MKRIVTILALAALSHSGMAQIAASEFKDDLLPEKTSVLARYLPYSKAGGFQPGYYMMPVQEVEQKLAAVKKELMHEANKQKSDALKLLVEKEIDMVIRESLRALESGYGIDQAGSEAYQKILTEKRGDPNFTKLAEEARKKAFPKSLQADERTKLMNEIYQNPELDNEALLKRSASYRSWVTHYIYYLRATKYQQDTTLGRRGHAIVQLKVIKNEVPAGFVKEYLNYQFTSKVLKMAPDKAIIEEAYNNFMATALNPAYKEDIERIYGNYKMFTGKGISPEFSYADVDGKMVTLKSLRGKYVYIDVWATWCGPCKQEIPALQNVEHDYQNKNIHFVSLSVDKDTDKSKWIAYVKDNKLGGIQLMADNDFNSDFIMKYNIAAIPRFILIGPNGEIIDGNAKRPSDPALRTELDALL